MSGAAQIETMMQDVAKAQIALRQAVDREDKLLVAHRQAEDAAAAERRQALATYTGAKDKLDAEVIRAVSLKVGP